MSFHTLIPGTLGSSSLSVSSAEGAWLSRRRPSETGLIYDDRRGLGSLRPIQPRRCREFNGTNQYLWIAIDPLVAFPFTLFGWYRTSNNTSRTLCGVGSTAFTTKYMNLLVDEGNRISTVRSNTTPATTDVSTAGAADVWHSAVLVFDSATQITVYQDGELIGVTSGLSSVDLDVTFDRFHVGVLRSATPTEYYTGRAALCGMLRRAGTLQDAQKLHNTGVIPDAALLTPLDSNSTTVDYDIGVGHPPALPLDSSWSIAMDY
jgi:hypothetical protein